MTDDVTIPRETAREMAAAWRAHADGATYPVAFRSTAAEWADLLDPPKPSLRDEACARLTAAGYGEIDRQAVDIVTATIRDHVAALQYTHDGRANALLMRRDVLALFDGAES
jgi:hypothetical protein